MGENLWSVEKDRARRDTEKKEKDAPEVVLGKSGQRQLVSLSVGIANEADSLLFHGGKVQINSGQNNGYPTDNRQQTTDNRHRLVSMNRYVSRLIAYFHFGTYWSRATIQDIPPIGREQWTGNPAIKSPSACWCHSRPTPQHQHQHQHRHLFRCSSAESCLVESDELNTGLGLVGQQIMFCLSQHHTRCRITNLVRRNLLRHTRIQQVVTVRSVLC